MRSILQLNEKYGGFAIEMEWEGKKIFYTNGNVTWKVIYEVS